MALMSPITTHFVVGSELVGQEPIERGHINRTYLSVVQKDGQVDRYIYQLINKAVFPNPPRMMDNIRAVLDHLHAKRGSTEGTLELVQNADGSWFHQDDEGEFWRCYRYIENSSTYDIVPNPEIAYQAALAFGTFLNEVSDLPTSGFHITIPDFHNTEFRLSQLDAAMANPAPGRISLATEEIDFVNRHRELGGRLMHVVKRHPEAIRIVHNDTKVNNVLFCDQGKVGKAVIDLDTVMPGTVLFDIGDLIRTACNAAAEDEQDLSKVIFNKDHFAAIIRGFAESTGSTIHPAEWDAMPYSGAIITMTVGIRFLTDFLNGDTYFRTHRENQNLDRCRTQFELVRQMLDNADELERIVMAERARFA